MLNRFIVQTVYNCIMKPRRKFRLENSSASPVSSNPLVMHLYHSLSVLNHALSQSIIKQASILKDLHPWLHLLTSRAPSPPLILITNCSSKPIAIHQARSECQNLNSFMSIKHCSHSFSPCESLQVEIPFYTQFGNFLVILAYDVILTPKECISFNT